MGMPRLSSEKLQKPRYAVGIDLGTTNSAMSFVDLEGTGGIEDFPILQVVAPGETERRETLPSFHYEATPSEAAAGSLNVPWSQVVSTSVVGVLARDRGAQAPGRLVASAKSWLCHAGVDRKARILPWHGEEDVQRVSPVEVTARYLAHMRCAWNEAHPDHWLENQETVVTIPASFDEVARELTVAAIVQAGFGRVTLLEEPQAAFYAWMASHVGEWRSRLRPGQWVLVCDVGGGTTDFTLVETVEDGKGGVSFRRVAVGEHLILGGDNLDLALAHHVEPRLAGDSKLPAHQWSVLVRLCCQAKERLLGDPAPESLTISLPSMGSRLIGGSLQTEVTRAEVERLLLDGFLPRVSMDSVPMRGGSGFREFGLPYAADAAITRYLAEFLKRHAVRAPEAVLLNGGFFESSALRNRWLEILMDWLGKGKFQTLRNDRLDMAVARGAAYYGLVRRGRGVRIAAGLPRTYYVGVADSQGRLSAVCVAPSGLEEGSEIVVPGKSFELLLRQPAEFTLYASTLRTTDAPGDVVEIDPYHLTALPTMRTVLKTSRKASRSSVQVQLMCRVTEIGTFEVSCREVDGDRHWPLQFDLRPQPDSPADLSVDMETIIEGSILEAGEQIIHEAFEKESISLAALPRALEERTGMIRADWPPVLLRRLWSALMEHPAARKQSPAHEARWLNLVGFCLRPGFGAARDEERMDEMWKLFPQGVLHPKNELCRAEWWILWRRIAGGLNEGRQSALASPLVSRLKAGKGSWGCGPHEAAEIWRMVACLERLPLEMRRKLGERLADRLVRKGWGGDHGAASWALARLAARVPMYGSLHTVLPTEPVFAWLEPLLAIGKPRAENLFEVAMMARRTGDRYRDIEETLRLRILDWLREQPAPAHTIALVEDGGELAPDEQATAAGDSLPVGLRWLHA